jgi:F0F1-type ATP synthase assembly protein I
MGNRWAGALRFMGIGWYVAGCIVLGVLGGRWVGQQFDFNGSLALFTILGLLLGLVLAFYGVYRILKSAMADEGDNGSDN